MIGRRAFAGGALSALTFGSGCRRLPDQAKGRAIVPFWYAYGGKNRAVMLELIQRFHDAQNDVYIDAVYQGDYFEALAKVRTALAAGAAPPLTHVVAEIVPYLAETGVLEPLDGYGEIPRARLLRALAQDGAFAGGDKQPFVSIPFNRSTPIMFVNADLLAKEGVAIPTTWSELRDAAKKLTRRDPVRWGFVVPVSWWFWFAMMGQAGGTLVEPNGEPSLGGASGERAIQFLQQLVHEDRVMRPPPGRDYSAWTAANQDFLAGRAALLWTSTAYVRYLEENASFKVVAAPLPRDVRAAVPTGGTFFVVLKSANAELKAAAARFLAWMSGAGPAASFATRTGYIPISEDAIAQLRADGYYQRFPNDQVALEQLAAVDPWPWVSSLFRVERDIIDPRLEDAVFRNLPPRTVLDEARRLARRALR